MPPLRSSVRNILKRLKPPQSRTDTLRVYQEKVVIIHSPFKTGTTTVGGALVMMGFADRDHGFHRNLNRGYKQQIEKANKLAMRYDSFSAFEASAGKKVIALMYELLQHARGYKIFGDVPFGHLRIHPFVKKLLMPNAKFIWINRDEEAWLESARKWQLAHPEIYLNADKRWADNPEGEKQKLIRLRDDGFREFRKLQREFPQDCLVMSLESDDKWRPLCDFLDLPSPDTDFPLLNKFTG
jgi:Sulfotransferase domain